MCDDDDDGDVSWDVNEWFFFRLGAQLFYVLHVYGVRAICDKPYLLYILIYILQKYVGRSFSQNRRITTRILIFSTVPVHSYNCGAT